MLLLLLILLVLLRLLLIVDDFGCLFPGFLFDVAAVVVDVFGYLLMVFFRCGLLLLLFSYFCCHD